MVQEQWFWRHLAYSKRTSNSLFRKSTSPTDVFWKCRSPSPVRKMWVMWVCDVTSRLPTLVRQRCFLQICVTVTDLGYAVRYHCGFPSILGDTWRDDNHCSGFVCMLVMKIFLVMFSFQPPCYQEARLPLRVFKYEWRVIRNQLSSQYPTMVTSLNESQLKSLFGKSRSYHEFSMDYS